MSSFSKAVVRGVGILGAGPITQAIHLPSLAQLGNILEVRHIMDVDAVVAESVAARVGANHSTHLEALLDDPGVDVLTICSPHEFHTDQVIAACRAGKKGILPSRTSPEPDIQAQSTENQSPFSTTSQTAHT